MAKLVLIFIMFIFILVAVILVKTLLFTSQQLKAIAADLVEIDEKNAVSHLSQAIQHQTL